MLSDNTGLSEAALAVFSETRDILGTSTGSAIEYEEVSGTKTNYVKHIFLD